MRRAALFALCLSACINWDDARSRFFSDGGATGGGSATGGSGGAAAGGTGGGSVGAGGGGGIAQPVDDGGIQCQHSGRWQTAIAGRVVALGYTSEGLIGVGSAGANPLLVAFDSNGTAHPTPLISTTGRFDALAVTADGHRMAATGTSLLMDGGHAIMSFDRVDGGNGVPFPIPDSSTDFETVTGIAFDPLASNVLFIVGQTFGGQMMPFPSEKGAYIATVNLDANDEIGAAGAIIGDGGCSHSDVAVLADGAGRHIFSLGSAAASCDYEYPPADDDGGVTHNRFFGSWIDNMLNGLQPLFNTASGPAASSPYGYRDRFTVAADGGFVGVGTTELIPGGLTLGAIFSNAPALTLPFSYSGDGSSVALGSIVRLGSSFVVGGARRDDAGTSGVVWELPGLTGNAASSQVQLCSNAIVTDVLVLPDGGIVAAAVFPDGGDFTLVQQL